MKRWAWPVSMHLEHGDVIGAVLDGVGHPVQQLLAHGSGHVAPGLEGQGRCGRVRKMMVNQVRDG